MALLHAILTWVLIGGGVLFLAALVALVVDTILMASDPDYRSVLDHERAMDALRRRR